MNILKFRIIILIVNFSVFISAVDLMQKSTTRCETICNNGSMLSKDLLGDCQRGCQYFNIEFLVSATDVKKVVDIQTIENKCKSSCDEAYIQLKRRDSCFMGCHQMLEVQQQAPYINDWIIYMGASDKGMVLMSPDMDIPSANDWILLETFLKTDDYNYVDQYKFSDSMIAAERIPTTINNNFLIDYCLPIWMWILPALLLLWVLWTICGNTLFKPDFSDLKCDTNEIINNDRGFYPSPALLPPKYMELEKEFFQESSEPKTKVVPT